MFLNGLIFEDGGSWLADIAALDLMVPAEDQAVAFELIQDVFSEEFPEVDADFQWVQQSQGVFTIYLKKPGQIFHHIVQQQRQSAEMSLAKLASKLKKTTAEQLGEIESGRSQMTVAQFFTIMDVLGFDVYLSVRKRD